MKKLFLLLTMGLFFQSCNIAKIVTGGETKVDPDFFDGAGGGSLYHELGLFWNFNDPHGVLAAATPYVMQGPNGNQLIFTTDATPGTTGPGLTTDGFMDTQFYKCHTAACNPAATLGNMNYGTHQDLTIAMWIKPGVAPSGDKVLTLEIPGTDIINVIADSSEIFLQYTTTVPTYTTIFSFPKILSNSNWTHIVMVIKRTGGSYAYVDGVYTSATVDIDSTTKTFDFNGASLTPTTFLGYLDDVGVWGRELGEREVYQLYTNKHQFH